MRFLPGCFYFSGPTGGIQHRLQPESAMSAPLLTASLWRRLFGGAARRGSFTQEQPQSRRPWRPASTNIPTACEAGGLERSVPPASSRQVAWRCRSRWSSPAPDTGTGRKHRAKKHNRARWCRPPYIISTIHRLPSARASGLSGLITSILVSPNSSADPRTAA